MIRRFRWCSADPTHYSPPWQEFCACGADFIEPAEILQGRVIRPCPYCRTQNEVHADRVGLHGVCEGCGRLLAVCSQDATLIRTDTLDLRCPACGKGYVIPPPDTWNQVAGGPTRPGSTPERLFSDVAALVPAWPDWNGFHNPNVGGGGVWYQLAPPIITREILLLQDSNRTLHGIHLESGCALEPDYTALSQGGFRSAPAAEGEYVYLSGLPGRLVAYALDRIGTESVAEGTMPVPDYGIDLPGIREQQWDSFRPPVANEAAGTVVCTWWNRAQPYRYRLTCCVLNCGGGTSSDGGHKFPEGPWLWDLELPAQPLGHPVLTDAGVTFLPLAPNRILRVDPTTREGREVQLADTEIRDGALYDPEQNRLVVNTQDGRLVALDGDTLEIAWRWRPTGAQTELKGPGCLIPGATGEAHSEIWVVDLDGRAEAVRVSDGLGVRWFPHLERGQMVTAEPSACGNALLIPMGQDLVLARPDYGRFRPTYTVVAHVPAQMGRIVHQVAIAQRKVVVVTETGRVMAYQVPEGQE